MTRAVQYIDTLASRLDAEEQLAGLALQDGFLGGRILPPTSIYPGWRLQAFFHYESGQTALDINSWLPTGCRVVLIPDGLARSLGIKVHS